jgi:uncharacterized protein YigE (DUF2233 family)
MKTSSVSKIISVIVILGIILIGIYFLFEKSSNPNQNNELSNIQNFIGQQLQPKKGQILSPCTNLEKSYLDQKCATKMAFASFGTGFNNNLELDKNGNNYILVFDPKSEKLDFKVNVGIDGDLNQKNEIKKYIPKTFEELIKEQNSLLNGRVPIFAINSDYIDTDNKPQGLNVSRGVSYSGNFAKKRSSFAISKDGIANIQIGERKDPSFQYNTVGGNGRFLENGVFVDICDKLGQIACFQETSRSMVAITDQGWVIMLVHRPTSNQQLLPVNFENFLTEVANFFKVGKVVDGMLFDGGASPALMYDGIIYQQGFKPIGSVFMIYIKE